MFGRKKEAQYFRLFFVRFLSCLKVCATADGYCTLSRSEGILFPLLYKALFDD